MARTVRTVLHEVVPVNVRRSRIVADHRAAAFLPRTRWQFIGVHGGKVDRGNRRKSEDEGKRTLLLGVTFALLDMAEQHPMPLRNTVIMETGGMKGRRPEMVREELHAILQRAFGVYMSKRERDEQRRGPWVQ